MHSSNSKPRRQTHRQARKIRARKLTLVLFALFAGALVLSAVIYSIVNPSPHAPQSHAQPSTSAPAPTHAKPAPTHTAPSPACTTPAKPSQGVTPTPSKPAVVKYTVKRGDNLSTIAAHYHLHSYVPLYDANMAAIGNNPNVIHIGLRLTVPKELHVQPELARGVRPDRNADGHLA